MNKTEPGLEHIKKLHINSFRNGRGIYNELGRRYGQKRSREIIDEIVGATTMSLRERYEKKNADYEISMIFTGGFDADIVRKTCNWIDEHKDEFGDEILDVGCDCGFVTTFLGSVFPDKHITAIERCKEGIEIAKQNVAKFGLTNVDFICDDVINLKDRQFDTVFSMRTMLENGESIKENPYDELTEMADKHAEAKKDYAAQLASLVKEGGNLISIERTGIDALLLAWLKDMAAYNMKLKAHTQIKCTELGKDLQLQMMTFVKEDGEINAFDAFMECFSNYTDLEEAEYTGWPAKILYESEGGKNVLGYESTDTRNNTKNKVIIRMHNTEEDCFLLYNNNNGIANLSFVDVSDLEAVKDSIIKSLDEVKKHDFLEITEID